MGSRLFRAIVAAVAWLVVAHARAQTLEDLAIEAPQALDAFAGARVTGIDVLVDDDWRNTRVPVVKRVTPGELFSPTLARRALHEVLGTGMFAQGGVSVVSEPGGVRLIVRVKARKLIDHVRLELRGARVDRDEVLGSAGLGVGAELTSGDLAKKQDQIARVLRWHGYAAPQVELLTGLTDDPLRIVLVVDVVPGRRMRVARRFFYVFDQEPASLRAQTDQYLVRAGDPADKGALEAADADLLRRLRADGYHSARVSHDELAVGDDVTLRVRVAAGSRFLPRFEGNDHFDADALTAALGLSDEPDRSPGRLVQKLREFYQKRGFLDVEVKSEVRGDPGAPTRFLVFRIVEHARVSVAARTYPCLRQESIARLAGGGPKSTRAVGNEIDSFLEEELPGAQLASNPDPRIVDALTFGTNRLPDGARAVPLDLDPNSTYYPRSYEHATAHVQELYRNEGFLSAEVGPVQVLRRRCASNSPAGRCIPLPLPPLPNPARSLCRYDATSRPLPVQPLEPAYTCTPDPARGVECEPAVALQIPIRLGPRTALYDIMFEGVRSLSERALVAASKLALGEPASRLNIEEAARAITDAYKEEGFAFATVRYALEPSLDRTRARVRFDVLEGEQVVVHDIVIRGNEATSDGVIRRRVALVAGEPYRTSAVRNTQDRITALNVFSSVNDALEQPEIPQKRQRVIITVVEAVPQYVEVRPGVSTGEGVRLAIEYGHRNMLSRAIGFNARVRFSYLPNEFIADPQVLANFRKLSLQQRIVARITTSLVFPDVGLGPLVSTSVDTVYLTDLQRDFRLVKGALSPTWTYRPIRGVQISSGPSFEMNNVNVFNGGSVETLLADPAVQDNIILSRALRVPSGQSYAIAQRLSAAWDRRDDALNPRRGTYLAGAVEHVDAFPRDPSGNGSAPAQTDKNSSGHFVKFTQTFSAYLPLSDLLPLPDRFTLAMQLRIGQIAQLIDPTRSRTYPDRLFFMGGVDSLRGFLQDSLLPEDYYRQILANPEKLSITSFPLRGGNLMINPRVELRIPLRGILETVVFLDTGNVWADPFYVYDFRGPFVLRAAAGTGLRVQLPFFPLAFDWGYNLDRRWFEDASAFHFAIGLY